MRNARVWFGLVVVGASLAAVVAPRPAAAQVAAFQPTVGTIPDGVSLDAVPIVSADRRYVRLSLNPSFQTVNGFTNVAIPFAVSGLGSGTGAGAAAGALGGAGFPGAGGFRSVGVPFGMNGPVAESGFNSGMAAASGANFEYSSGDDTALMDDGSWTPAPRRAKTTRSKSARTRSITPPAAPVAALVGPPRPAAPRAKP